jgi:hypothetical protein
MTNVSGITVGARATEVSIPPSTKGKMILSEEEKLLYGNRFPKGYKKVRALGK